MTSLKKLRKIARPEPTLPKTNIVPLKGLMSPPIAPPNITLESYLLQWKTWQLYQFLIMAGYYPSQPHGNQIECGNMTLTVMFHQGRLYIDGSYPLSDDFRSRLVHAGWYSWEL
jgi:hypothetical protein